MRGKPITFSFYVGGQKVDKLSEEQLSKMSGRLSKSMSEYYTAHPDEYIKLTADSVDVEQQPKVK